MSPSSETSAFAAEQPFASAMASLTGNLGLTADDARRLCRVEGEPAIYAPGAEISAADEAGPRLILSGWACEMRQLLDGRRQIFSFLMPGDISLPRPDSRRSAFTLVALTSVSCVDLAEPEDSSMPILPVVLRTVQRLNESRRYDAVLRLGQLSASERTINLLLELRARMLINGTASGDCFHLPITQKQMADALGLSLVHVNRTLKELRRQSLLTLKFGTVTLLQPQRLSALAMSDD